MKKILERVVASDMQPGSYDLWIDTNNENPELKVSLGGEGWKSVGGGSGGSGGSSAQIQSDWNQTDDTKVDYIKNKPTIPSVSPVIVVKGTIDDSGDLNFFVPDAGEPSFA